MKLITTLLIASTFAASAASAATIDLTRNTTQSDSARLFQESSDVVIDDFVSVDFVVGDNLSVGVTTAGIDTQRNPKQLGAGIYDSWLIHYDPNGAGSTTGSFDFVGKIVAVILSNKRSGKLLNSTDMTFGNTTDFIYETNVGRRTEAADTFMLLDSNTLSYNLSTNDKHIDNIRVITEVTPVPVPASLSLLLAGVGGLAVLRRRKKA